MRPRAMRRLIRSLTLLVVFLLGVGQAEATIALVAHTMKQSTDSNATTTTAINTTGATLLIVGIAQIAPNTCAAPTDSAANTWVQVGSTSGSSTPPSSETCMWYVKNPTTSASHTFTGGATATFPNILVAAFSGTDTTANVDQTTSHSNTNGGGNTTVQPGSITPSVNNEVVVTLVSGDGTQNGETWSINGGFTIADSGGTVNSQSFGGGLAYLIQTTAAAANPTWTSTLTTAITSFIASFKEAGAAPTLIRHRSKVD